MDDLSFLMKYASQKQASVPTNGSSDADFLLKYGKSKPVSTSSDNNGQNNGGFWGGLGYLGEKIGLGFLSSVEGIWDFTAGGLAKLFGADDWAEQQFSNDWVNYNHADEWFNPSKGWQVAGDVAGGIGTSLPAILTVAAIGAITVATAGTTLPLWASMLTTGVVAGLGAAGTATKQAYRETGELGGKEFGYGALSGLTEGGVEALSAGIGVGTGAIVKKMSESAARQASKSLLKETGKELLKSFVGEAFEEGLSEFLDPYWKRMTYDPNAKNATLEEIGYAALIGGLSGAIMSGVDVSVRSTVNTVRGANLVNKGKAADVIATAENIVADENAVAQYDSFENVKNVLAELKGTMKKTGGEIRTIRQKTLLGYLQQANVYTVFEPTIQKNAAQIIANADRIAERMNAYGYTDASGNPIKIEAAQLREGYDVNDRKSFRKALKNNNLLRTLAVIDTTGQLYMDTKAFEQATLRGEALSSQVDLNRFIETATKEELDSVAERLEIADWQGLTNEQFKEKIVAFSQNGGVETYQAEQTKKAELRASAEAVSPDKAKKRIPKSFTTKNDGVVRYSQNGVDMAIIKDGDTYRIFDYEKGRLSKTMTLEQLNSELTKIKEGLDSELTRLQESQTDTRESQEAAELDKYAAENISAYSKLSDANKSLVRGVIRQARAAGISDADALSYARVSAKAGVNISFDKQAKVGDAEVLLVGKNTETGAPVYADGVYLAQTNTIYVNPEAKRSHERLLIHELTHAIYRGKGGSVILMKGVETMSTEEKEAIIKRYRAAGHGSAVELVDEINAHFAEGQLTNKKLLQRLTEDAPTIKQRILAFFKKSATAYSEDERLSGTAKKLYKQYKKLFDSFAEENQGNNAFETQVDTVEGARYATSNSQYDFSKPFTEQIDDYKNGVFPKRDTFIVSGTPKVYQDIGFNALPMTINRTHVDYALNGTKNAEHRIGESLLKQLPEALKSPIAVIASKTSNSTSVVVLLEMKHNGATVIAPVYLDGEGRQNGISIDSNAVTSVHGRSNAVNGLLKSALQAEASGNISVFYWNKNKTANLMTTAKVTMPQGLSLSNGLIHSILENGSPVKPKLKNVTESQQFKRWFGKSKVVNADGSPKVLYHQTSADFTVFSTENPVAGENDSETPNGIFLKDNDHDIGIGGEKQMALFARMEKPLHFANREEARSWYIKHIPIYAEVQAEFDNLTNEFEKESARLEQQWFDANKRDDNTAIDKIEAQEDELIKNFEPIETKYSQKLRSLLNDYFLHGNSQYDGIILDYDGHRYVNGKRENVHTYIVFDNTQIKSATDNIGTFSKTNSDIRYALPDDVAGVLFDDEFYSQFEKEDRTKITETVEELEAIKNSKEFDGLSWDEQYTISQKRLALKAGYTSLYDYFVGQAKKRVAKDYAWYTERGEKYPMLERKKANSERAAKLQKDIAAASPMQNAQFKIIQDTNPMWDDQHVGIRSPLEIRTFAEVINDTDSFNWGDFSKKDAQRALKRGTVRIYSSYPIKNGVFVSTSYQQALDYAGGDASGVHSRVAALDSVAWINGDEGQYAKVYKKEAIRYALPDTVESDIVEHYGKTYRWTETGYLLKDGTRVDLSGRNEGASGGYRSIDHRDVFDGYDVDGTDAMVEFMSRGNIRVMPEGPAINMQLEPTEEQYRQIGNLVETLAWKEKEFTVDFDDNRGNTVDSLSYEGSVSWRKVVSDIRYYFKEGKVPYQSDLSKFRYALSDDTDEGSMGGYSRGQRAKFAANNTALKVYSRADAEAVINEIMEERFIFEDDGQYGEISARTRDEVVDYLFRKLNTVKEGYRIPVALNIADYLIEHATIVDMYADGVASEAIQELQVYRSFMHRIDLSGIQKEIEYTFDKRNGINMVWGAPKGKGIAPDTLGMELEEYGIFLKGDNEADLFIQLVERYRKARDLVAEGVKKQTLLDVGSKQKLEDLRQKIARDILIAYDERGAQSKYGKLVEKYTAQIDSLKQQVKNNRRDNAMRNRIIDDAKYLREIAEKRSYVSADVFNAPELTAWLKLLGRLQFRSDLRKTGVRQILLDYGLFYNENNNLLYDEDPNLTYIDNNVLDALALIRQNENSTKELSFEELQAAQVIMASAKHLFQNYDQMILEGRKVRISEVAAQGNEILLRSKNHVGRGFFNGIYGVFNKIVEPRVVIKSLENYDPRGILTRAYSEITKGETEAGVLYIRLVENFDTFFAKNKSYKKRLASEYVTVGGKRLTVGQAISLYELSKREQARAGLFEAGFSFMDEKGAKQSVTISQSDIDALAQTFTETDKQFIAVVEEFFNVRSKQVKTEADLEILGYTNASEDFYFPIKRDSGTIAKNITDARDIMADWANVYNFSFNKDVKKGAANKLFITDVYSVVTRHAQQLSTYAKLTVPLKNFSQIYSRNIGTKTNVITIRNTINERVWGGAENYLRKLFSDIQGKTTSSSFIEKLRGAYAKYQLGANAKVIVSQVTSYPTAAILLDVDCLARGAVMKTNYAAMDEYCGFAKVRNYEKGIVKAEGVIDTVGKLGDLFTKPIQWTDRLTIGKLWNACQVQVQKTNGYKIGTVENMTAAGVLLEEVTRLTQPNYSNSERSELMRSDSDIVRSFTMFTSVPLKQLSRLVESVGEFTALRQMIRSGDTSVEVAERYKVAKRKLGRTIAAITVANMFYVLVGQFFKWLFDKDRKDKDGNEISFVKDLLNDFVSTTVGMLPIVRDIYNFFANDYEFNNFAYETVNNVLTASKELFEMASKAASGEDMSKSDFGKPLRDSLYAIGQITGLPFRNINNQISGLVKHFDPSAAYKYNSMFYNAQYSKDIKKALEKGDTELANTIMSMLLNESRTGDLNDAARGKLTELYGKGYTVLPRTVGNTITYNNETVPMTEQQRKQFVSICSQANGYIEKMIASPRFEKLAEDRQAKAIKSVYDAYYYQAVSDLLGTDANNTLGDLSRYIALDKLAIAFSELSEITSDVDKSGNVINGSKKKKTIAYLLKQNLTDGERLLILYYRGYTIMDGDFKGYTKKRARTVLLKYILGLKATAAQKAQIASECGFTVKNGKIVRSSV